MSKWIDAKVRLPKQGQWVVVVWGDFFKAGRFDAKHPFSPVVTDSQAGKFYRHFTHWKPLSAPKVSL
jgi:hypothetical protein